MSSPLHFSALINAPRERVYSTMLNHPTYEQWTEPFSPGSTYNGSWDLGSNIRFTGPDNNGGCAGHITICKPFEQVQITFDGDIAPDGSIIPSGLVQATETYTFYAPTPTSTQLDIELAGMELSEEMRAMFDDMWPRALQKLKAICEGTTV